MDDPAQVLLLLDTLLRALGTKMMELTTLAMTFALFCWAMRLQSSLAFGIAGLFGFGVLLPVLFIGLKRSDRL